ncbi:MAG: hypothetical protein WBP55_08985 [Solirubrobacterales bacterium]
MHRLLRSATFAPGGRQCAFRTESEDPRGFSLTIEVAAILKWEAARELDLDEPE